MKLFILSLASLLVVISGCSSSLQSGALINARKYYNNGEYDKALSRLSVGRARSDVLQPNFDIEYSFLRARIFEKKGSLMDAVGSYKYIIGKYPDKHQSYISKERLKVIENALNRSKELYCDQVDEGI